MTCFIFEIIIASFDNKIERKSDTLVYFETWPIRDMDMQGMSSFGRAGMLCAIYHETLLFC